MTQVRSSAVPSHPVHSEEVVMWLMQGQKFLQLHCYLVPGIIYTLRTTGDESSHCQPGRGIIHIQNSIPTSAFLGHSWHQRSQIGSKSDKVNGMQEYSSDNTWKRETMKAELVRERWNSQYSLQKSWSWDDSLEWSPLGTEELNLYTPNINKLWEMDPPWEGGMIWVRQYSSA